MNIADVQSVITSAVGATTSARRWRRAATSHINMRYPREIRDSLEKLRVLPIVSESGQRLVLSMWPTSASPAATHAAKRGMTLRLGVCGHSRA